MAEASGLLNAITWEQLLFVFSVVFIFLFRKPICILIPRIRKIGRDGVSTESAPEIQLEKQNSEAVSELLNVVQNTIVITDLEERIKHDLKVKNLSYDSDTEKVLTRHLAGTQLLLNFEQIHTLIFGSQIYLLKKLNESVGQGRSVDFVLDHIAHAKELFSNNLGNWPDDKYLNFLYERHLIVRHEEQIHITNLGVEYLVWIARSGKSDSNPL
ncbi:hypothetical protein [Amphritea balenae]|uniref:Uncharacterized protein n=1 Tax=Amphritea balenae TaxID=452629 RepID=A0A3P1SWT7_9GAMM|nr:hypothetical protein [Amphritea balenae]RRD01445.1 hypothetical protein EHS89_02475 [Amphritea balenae]GGK57053.1 hypothetical protein GCM10007941_03990 [Amphritea balenae]